MPSGEVVLAQLLDPAAGALNYLAHLACSLRAAVGVLRLITCGALVLQKGQRERNVETASTAPTDTNTATIQHLVHTDTYNA